jgi:hypothetical protein
MFEPNEESVVLEIVSKFFNIQSDDMIKIGDLTKNILFGPGANNEKEAVEKLRTALKDMSNEQALIAGMFLSGLLRCNLASHIQQQYMQEMAEEDAGGCDGQSDGKDSKS